MLTEDRRDVAGTTSDAQKGTKVSNSIVGVESSLLISSPINYNREIDKLKGIKLTKHSPTMVITPWKIRSGARSVYLSLNHANPKQKMAAKMLGGELSSCASSTEYPSP